MNPEIILRAPSELHAHPRVKHLLGRWTDASDDAIALRRSIKEHGLLQPLIITEAGLVMDGVTRLAAAKALQIKEVPCQVRDEADVLDIVIESETHRRHGTKGQLAFRLAPLIQQAFEARQANRLACLKRGQETPLRTEFATVKTPADYALEAGMSVRLMEQAWELHQLFDQHVEPRTWTSDEAVANLEAIGQRKGTKLSFADYFTPLLLSDHKPMGLGEALRGVKSRLTEEGLEPLRGKHKGRADMDDHGQLRLFNTALKDLTVRYEYWEKFNDEAKAKAQQTIAKTIETMPDDLLDAWQTRIRIELKRRESAAL